LGVDPIWNLAENKLVFLNSLKMKSSVIIGISQMTFGLVLSYLNYRHFQSRLDILTMFIPQIIFLSCIFIYLCLLIIVKWLVFWVEPTTVFGYDYPGSYCAPSLLIGLINMFMMKTNDDPKLCYLNHWYPGQGFFEVLFVLVAMACVPVMLFAKPYLLLKEHRLEAMRGVAQLVRPIFYLFQGLAQSVLLLMAVVCVPVMLFAKPVCLHIRQRHNDDAQRLVSVRADVNSDDAEVLHNNDAAKHHSGGGHDSKSFDLGDIMVYQAIHTIEFVLGCVSHTASYLRLWALSLAHAQLSDVLWSMVLRQAFILNGYMGAIATYIIFFVFASLSVSILVLMEGLSAFLHSLRLHW
jgi:V-type H+-transporting ATPase subunit a